MGAPLPFAQSGLLMWPHLAGMVAALMVVFTIAYVDLPAPGSRA